MLHNYTKNYKITYTALHSHIKSDKNIMLVSEHNSIPVSKLLHNKYKFT